MTEPIIRPAVRQALAEHAPASKRYAPDGRVTKVCTCGLASDGNNLTGRTQHLEDVVVAAAVAALEGKP